MTVILKFEEPCKGQLTVPTNFVAIQEFPSGYQVMVKTGNSYHNFYHVKSFELLS